MISMPMSRRRLMAAAGALGAQFAFAAPGARAQGRRPRLVVVILRGAADGLSMTPPLGDPNYLALRRTLALTDDALRLDADFALHPELKTIHSLVGEGQARIAPAVAMPDRIRSHFEAQDKLENGATDEVSSGWLNRVVAELAGERPAEALAVGPVAPLILRGHAPAGVWSPGQTIDPAGRTPKLLADLYAGDPVLSAALSQGLRTEGLARTSLARLADGEEAGLQPRAIAGDQPEAGRRLGQAVAGFMTETAPLDIVALSLDGFDTHANQAGMLSRRLAYLDALIGGLRQGLGEAWGETVVLVVTEFGRTARTNGTAGTDHGTASTALVLGGAVKPGGIIGDWPGLAEAQLYENRDLAPTLDLRSLFKGVLAEHLGLDRRLLDTRIFPDSTKAAPVTGLV
jgi:uncharacterized protein (DUF1501 family)